MSDESATASHAKAPGLVGLRRTIAEYAGASALSVVLAWSLLELWNADLRVPFDYRGDSIQCSMMVKAIIEHGGYLANPLLGAPGQLDHHDYPWASEWVHILVIKLMALFTSDWALLTNVYFVLGFAFITTSALVVFRHFSVRFVPAAVGSILYAFLPSRVLKGESHLFLDAFYQVPLAVLVVLWVCSDTPPLFGARGASPWRAFDIRPGRSVAAVSICVLVSNTGLYYAFFAGFLLVAGGLWASAERRSLRNAFAGLTLGAVIVVGLVGSLLTSFTYQIRNGSNPEVGRRLPQEAEMYGLKIAQLLTPTFHHRLTPLRQFTDVYNAMAHGDGTSSLGLVGSIGFLILLGRVAWRGNPADPQGEVIRTLSVLNLLALLLATVGGFGSLFAWLVSAQVRGYSRMNVVIAFLALFAIVLLLERLQRYGGRLARVAPLGVLVVGLFDQVTSAAVRPYGAVKSAFAADAELVGRIEAILPRGAMVFELPYHSYPEAGAQHGMVDYDPLRPYLHSRTLRWSYPAMRNRFDDVWIRQVAESEPARIVSVLSDSDFGGILIDRPGYADNGSELELALARILETAPEVSTDGRLAFYSLAAYKRRSFADESTAEREQRRDRALHPPLLRWGAGFWYPETNPEGTFRWCSRSGEIGIENGSATSKWVSISMKTFAARPPARLVLEGDLLSESFEVPVGGGLLSRTFLVPPGDHVIHFRSDSKPVEPRLDTRQLVWGAENVVVTEAASPSDR